MADSYTTTDQEQFILKRLSGLRQVAEGMLAEYPKAVREGRLGTWQAAMISIIEVYGGEDMHISEEPDVKD